MADKDRQRDESVLAEIDLPDVMVVGVDVFQPDQVTAAINEVLERYEQINILANCADWNPFVKPEEYNIQYWQTVRSINLDGTWYFIQAVTQPTRKRQYGNFVNFGSSAGILAHLHQVPYCVF